MTTGAWAVVAIAAKNARLTWAVLVKGDAFKAAPDALHEFPTA